MRWDGVMKERRDKRRELAASWALFHHSPAATPHHTYIIPFSAAKRDPQQCSHTASVSAISEAKKDVYLDFLSHTEYTHFLFNYDTSYWNFVAHVVIFPKQILHLLLHSNPEIAPHNTTHSAGNSGSMPLTE